VITLLIYEGLVLVVHYAWAYATAFLVGFIYSTIANGKYVFRSSITYRKIALYFLTTVANLLIGLFVLHVLVDTFGVHSALAPLLVIVIMIPSNFLLTRFVLTGRLEKDQAR